MAIWVVDSEDGYGGGGGAGGGGATGGVGGTYDGRNIEFGRLLLAVSEGQIKGLVGADEDKLKHVFLNDAAIQAADDSFNIKGVSVALVAGTNTQAPIPGFNEVESEISVNVKVSNGTPVTQTISTANITGVRVRISVPTLKVINQTDGTESGTSVQIKIERQRTGYNGGAFEEVTPLDQGGVISGKFGSKYTKSFRVELPDTGSGAWTIRVTRLTANAPDVYTQNDTYWDSYTELTDAKMRYPNTACLAVMVDAKQFSSIPQVSADFDLKIVSVPTNYTPADQDPTTGVWTAATYATSGPGTTGGIWDGTFKQAFTRNPVWQFYDMAVNTRYGAGNYLTASKISAYDLYNISKLCDEMVDNGKGGTEPRYFCDIYIQGQEEAIKILDHFAGAFRGLVYWSSGKVTAVQDADSDPVAIYTAANVVDGMFTYEGSGRKARHTAAVVSWINPDAGYRQDTTYVESASGIARYGLNVAKVAGFGVTSEGLAKRLGYWTILSDLLAPETVSFKAGGDGALRRPGDVIQIMDPFRAGSARAGGRIVSATTTQVTLDSAVTLAGGTNYLKCQLPDGTIESKTITDGAGSHTVLTVSSAYSQAPSPEAVWIVQAGAVAHKYRIITIKEDGPLQYSITALYHDPTKYTQIETGIFVDVAGGNDVPAIAFPPVVSLSASETLRKQNDKIIAVLTAHWLPPTVAANGKTPVGYIAEASRDKGPWTPMAVDGYTAELQDVDLGPWRVRVIALYDTGQSTEVIASYTVLGKTAPPSDVTNFVASVADTMFQATWDPCPDLDFDHSIIKSPSTAGGDTTDALKWAHGTVVEGCDLLAVTTVALQRPATGSHDYWIKHVDTSGNESANPTKLTLAVNATDDYVTPTEKRRWQAEYDRLWAEKSTLDTRATNAGVTTEKTNYDNALTALDTYLNTLTGAQGWTPVAAGTGHWASYTDTYYLGTTPAPATTGVVFYSKFKDVWTTRDLLNAAILQASLATGVATDTFSPKLTWDFKNTGSATYPDPVGFTAGGTLTTSAPSAPDDQTSRTWTTTSNTGTGTFTLDPNTGIAFDLPGRDCYIIQARLKVVSGTWLGECYYSTDGSTFSVKQTVAAPTTGQWALVTWDLRSPDSGTAIQGLSSIKGFRIKTGGSGTTVVIVDYVSVGVYSHGDRAGFDAAINTLLRETMARLNVATFGNAVIANLTNLFPNPDSEILHVSAGGTLPDSSIGAVGVPNTYTGNQYSGGRCREIKQTTAQTVTGRISAKAGETYLFEAYIGGYSPGTPTVTIRPYDASGSALATQTLTGASGSFVLKSKQFTMPASTAAFDVAFHNAGGDGIAPALFDNIVLRKAVDANLVVDGIIAAKHIVAGAIQAYQMSIGPWLQFRANASGLTLQGRSDGSLTRATSSELTGPPALPAENSADAAVYMDDTRSYPSGDVKTFEAQWGGTTEDRGIILNMGTAFATSAQTGLLVIWSGTTLKVCGMTGIGKYPTNTTKTALTNGTATVSTTSANDDKLTVIYYKDLVPPASGGTANIRLRVLINGVSVLTMTDSDLGSYGGASQGGYAGVYLGGNVRMFMPRFGRGFVTIQDGVITADKLAASAIIAEKIAAGAITAAKLEATLILASKIKVGYTENGSGYATAGVQLDGTGGTPVKVGPGGMKIGPNGYLLDEVTMRALNMLDSNGANDSTFKGWYKGNNDTSTRSGAPDISKLTVTRRKWDTTNKVARLELAIQPTATNNNLDSMRFAKVQLIRQGALGTGQTRADLDTYYVPFTDRLYYNAADNNAGNACLITFETRDAGVSSGYPGCIVTLYNAHGPSDAHCFYSDTSHGDSDGTTLTDNGTTNAWGSGSGGGTGGGGGGGGGSCPGPLVPITTLRGAVLARDIKVGDVVVTMHETSFEGGAWPVIAVQQMWEENRLRLVMKDGREMVFTHNHRLLTFAGDWVELRDLGSGDILAGSLPGEVLYVEKIQGGPVYKITVDEAHTYMTEGLLSHNAKFLS